MGRAVITLQAGPGRTDGRAANRFRGSRPTLELSKAAGTQAVTPPLSLSHLQAGVLC